MRPEIRDQRPEARDQRPEARGQRPEARGQRPEARGQRREVRDARLETWEIRAHQSYLPHDPGLAKVSEKSVTLQNHGGELGRFGDGQSVFQGVFREGCAE